MNKIEETVSIDKFKCEFCHKFFQRESTIYKHTCEPKRRLLDKDKHGNRVGFQAWMQFYAKNTAGKKNRTYDEFIRNPYYTAFVKFGTYAVSINAINISRFTDWLLKNQIKIDTWCQDSVYNKYLCEYLRTEDPMDALHRSVETTIEWATSEGIQGRDYLRYGNVNRICQLITVGKISPWMLYHSNSGTQFLDTLNENHVKMIIDYINPEQWAIKFKRDPENVSTVKEILNAGGY